MKLYIFSRHTPFGIFVLVAASFVACSDLSSSEAESTADIVDVESQVVVSGKRTLQDFKHYSTIGLCDVSSLDSTIWFDLKYTTTDNFMKVKLYEKIDRPYLQRDVALRLMKCSEFLRSMDTSFHLLIYDAVRPVTVQWKMWTALDSIPPVDRVKFVSNPRNKSLHNYGAAVDLTICRSDRSVLDMGAGFDDIRLIAYPSKEAHFLSTGELTKEQLNNRQLLRRVMRSQQFRSLTTEWWHFNACPRWEARQKYQLLERE